MKKNYLPGSNCIVWIQWPQGHLWQDGNRRLTLSIIDLYPIGSMYGKWEIYIYYVYPIGIYIYPIGIYIYIYTPCYHHWFIPHWYIYICIYANIWGILMVNLTIYSIHGSYGYWCPMVLMEIYGVWEGQEISRNYILGKLSWANLGQPTLWNGNTLLFRSSDTWILYLKIKTTLW